MWEGLARGTFRSTVLVVLVKSCFCWEGLPAFGRGGGWGARVRRVTPEPEGPRKVSREPRREPSPGIGSDKASWQVGGFWPWRQGFSGQDRNATVDGVMAPGPGSHRGAGGVGTVGGAGGPLSPWGCPSTRPGRTHAGSGVGAVICTSLPGLWLTHQEWPPPHLH